MHPSCRTLVLSDQSGRVVTAAVLRPQHWRTRPAVGHRERLPRRYSRVRGQDRYRHRRAAYSDASKCFAMCHHSWCCCCCCCCRCCCCCGSILHNFPAKRLFLVGWIATDSIRRAARFPAERVDFSLWFVWIGVTRLKCQFQIFSTTYHTAPWHNLAACLFAEDLKLVFFPWNFPGFCRRCAVDRREQRRPQRGRRARDAGVRCWGGVSWREEEPQVCVREDHLIRR